MRELGYDRLILAAGSVNKLLPIPGVAEHAHGFRGVAEALYLRDHVIRQVELAAATDDPAERAARCTFVVVGAGYTGTEVAAQGPLLTRRCCGGTEVLRGQEVRWLLLDTAPRVLPGAGPAAVAGGGPGAAPPRGRGADGDVRARGDPPGRGADRRHLRRVPHAGVVRRRAARPAGVGDRPGDPEGPAGRRADAGRARPPGGVRLR